MPFGKFQCEPVMSRFEKFSFMNRESYQQHSFENPTNCSSTTTPVVIIIIIIIIVVVVVYFYVSLSLTHTLVLPTGRSFSNNANYNWD